MNKSFISIHVLSTSSNHVTLTLKYCGQLVLLSFPRKLARAKRTRDWFGVIQFYPHPIFLYGRLCSRISQFPLFYETGLLINDRFSYPVLPMSVLYIRLLLEDECICATWRRRWFLNVPTWKKVRFLSSNITYCMTFDINSVLISRMSAIQNNGKRLERRIGYRDMIVINLQLYCWIFPVINISHGFCPSILLLRKHVCNSWIGSPSPLWEQWKHRAM